MALRIHLLGRPRIESPSREVYRFRSRKSWAVLAVVLLSERAPTRSELASLLFPLADDPLRALRWALSEIRRALGEEGTVAGDPPIIDLPPGSVVDVEVLTRGSWRDAVRLEGLGGDLLDGFAIRDAPAFSSWLLSEQRHVAAVSEAILHEAALGSMSAGDTTDAIRFAVRATTLNPFDENHQALLLRLYRRAGDEESAARQFAAYKSLVDRELGTTPGPVIHAAMRVEPADLAAEPSPAEVEAIIEAGSAAVAAGAIESGVESLRTAVRLADRAGERGARIRSRLVLAEALIHSLRGFDEDGVAALHEIEAIAKGPGDNPSVARARVELGYVDFLRARYDRSVKWLTDALRTDADLPTIAKASTYLGCVESDRADYPTARALLERGLRSAQDAGSLRLEAFAASMLGRIDLLRGDLTAATRHLDRATEVAERDHWLAFLPWPQALRGEVALTRGDLDEAEESLHHAFARACQLGDPCWEGLASRGLALVAERRGDVGSAFDLLVDARRRNGRFADPYVWLDGYILDTQCTLGLRHDHPDTARWVEAMQDLTSRTDMKELVARALHHSGRLGNAGDGEAAAMVASEIESPVLTGLIGNAPGRASGRAG